MLVEAADESAWRRQVTHDGVTVGPWAGYGRLTSALKAVGPQKSTMPAIKCEKPMGFMGVNDETFIPGALIGW